MTISTPMLLASLPCEDIARSTDERLNIHRVLFDIYAPVFPARLGRLIIVNIWRGGNVKVTDTTRLIAPDGALLAEGESTFQTAKPGQHIQTYLFTDLTLPEEGEYTVEVRRDAVTALSYTLEVVKLELEGGS